MSDGAFVPPQLEAPPEVLRENEVGEAKESSVPVVVLGANIAGLAAAVAIRSRTGRAVCVIDVDGDEEVAERESDTESTFLLSAKSLDAVRAINADFYRALLAAISEKIGATDPASCTCDLPLRLPASLLQETLLSHLTAGTGGSSFFWRSSPLKHIKVLSPEESQNAEDGHGILIAFENGISIRARLVIVATESFPFLEQKRGRTCVEGIISLPEGFGDGLWLLRDHSDPEVPEIALLSESDKQQVTFVACSQYSEGTIFPDSPTEETVASIQKSMATLQKQSVSDLNGALLSAVLEEISNAQAIVRSQSALNGVDSTWSFWGGRLILTGPAAHPWASSTDEAFELDLEDAAQLGCSLYDWKFAIKLASDRFQAIRKRRLSLFPKSPRIAKSWSSDSHEAVSGASTVAASPEVFFDEEETFVPTRDAYAELLPAVGLGYEVQEVEFN